MGGGPFSHTARARRPLGRRRRLRARAVVVSGRLVPADRATLSIDDPGARWGEGLFETMRAEGGRVPLLRRHLDRLLGSFAALGLAPPPGRDELEAAVALAVGACPGVTLSVRLTVTPAPTTLVEAGPLGPGPARLSARTARGAWLPGNRLAEHKTLSYAGYRLAARRAHRAGDDVAILLDADGRLGEADIGSILCAIGGDLVTAPVDGLLPGVARAAVLERLAVREEALAENDWRAADEIVLTNAVRGAVPVVRVDGAPVGDGRPGPGAALIGETLRRCMAEELDGG